MTALAQSNSKPQTIRSRALTGILEHAIASLELTQKQRDSIDETYAECGQYLIQALGLQKHLGDIFPQGSMRLGTVIRPYNDITQVFDLDIVFRMAILRQINGADSYRESVGTHLKAKYNGTVKPLPKGWRLDFSEERDYHLDVIPAMDSDCGGNVIAITDGRNWKDSNPRGYAGEFFEPIAELVPRFEKVAMLEEGITTLNCASIEPLPEHTHFKSPLQRITQISKRHRDYYFNKKTKAPAVATPSIVLTTMLALSYKRLVLDRTFASGFDLLLACVEDMPSHIERRIDALGNDVWWLPNPSLPNENLVEKWRDNRHDRAFHAWHTDYVNFLGQLLDGDKSPRSLLADAFGASTINNVFAKQAETITTARLLNKLTVNPEYGSGLALGTVAPVSATHIIHGH